MDRVVRSWFVPDVSEHLDRGEARSWKVRGMDCASCVAKVERAVSRVPGVQDVSVNLMAETLAARVHSEEAAVSVLGAVTALGYEVQPERQSAAAPASKKRDDHGHEHAGHNHAHSEDDEAQERAGVRWWRTSKAKLVWLLGALVIVAYLGSRLFAAEAYWIFVAAPLIAVYPFGRRALAMARAGTPFSIETLMVTAALGAVVIGAAEEAAFVVVLFAVGELLENAAANQARAGIKALANLMPSTARVERAGSVLEVPASQLALGDVVQVRPGDRMPCDGEVVEGQSAVDESPVTGESVPVARGPGDRVVAARSTPMASCGCG